MTAKEIVADLWNTHSVHEIADKCGLRWQSVYRIASDSGLPRRKLIKHDDDKPGPGDPSVDEIKERASQIRMGWSPQEEANRLVGNRASRHAWTPPVVSFSVR